MELEDNVFFRIAIDTTDKISEVLKSNLIYRKENNDSLRAAVLESSLAKIFEKK